jgi:PIN like domain
MRNLFSWRLQPSEADFSKLWEDAVFVFDTNFLLDLYRVSRSTVEDFLKILEYLQNRIWLPYQVADEFFRRREEVINSEAASFDKAISALEKWKSEQHSFSSLRGNLSQAGRIVAAEVAYLFNVQKDYLNAVDEVEKTFREKINELAKAHSTLDADKDSILESLLLLFDSKVGEPYDKPTLQSLYKEAEDRYKKSQPPGFMDVKDKDDERKYGDFLLWKQILTFAKRESRPIIFVTGEKKEDWWIKKKGETVAPQIELRREFQEYVNQPFWMYRTQRFIEMAKEKLIVEIDPRSIEETNAIADVELIDEQDNETLKQAIEKMRIPDLIVQQALEGIRTPDSELRKALERIRTPDSELMKAIKRIRTPDSELMKAIKRIQTPDLTVQYAMQQAIEQMGFELKKALERIPPDFAVQQIPKQMQRSEEKGKEIKSKPKARLSSKRLNENKPE